MRAVVLVALFAIWCVVGAVALARAQRNEVPLSTQLYVDRQMSTRDRDIATIRQDVAVISDTATRAANEVREMRMALWGCAGTILISLFMQVIEIRRRKQGP